MYPCRRIRKTNDIDEENWKTYTEYESKSRNKRHIQLERENKLIKHQKDFTELLIKR